MSVFNSIRSTQYLLYLIILITTGCAEKVSTHAFIKEPHPSVIEIVNIAEETFPYQDSPPAEEPEAAEISYTSAWDRLFSLYALPDIDNERIDYEIQQYLKHPEYLTKIQRRASPYLHFILDEIEAKEIPGELALLPIVESAFLPQAISKSKAAGLWQFMPATGRFFGLKQNWWYDGRRDIYTSTQAATTYLKQLSDVFNDDWFLALAAYNAGKGNIRKAIRKNQKET